MPDTPTPGEIAYTAYWHSQGQHGPDLDDTERHAWEAAAQAVLDHRDFPPLDLSLREEDTP